METVELFAGAGGLAMACSDAGFNHDAVIEWNKFACDTLRENKSKGILPIAKWPIHEADVRFFNFSQLPSGLDLLAGGPPCQPFSIGGKHKGFLDSRDMFPEAVRAVRELQPKVFLFENVKGLLRGSFSKYFEYIFLQLSYPEINRKKNEDWMGHLSRLEKYHTKGKHDGLAYRVIFSLLNAANYGVPQKRERVFVVGFRTDLNIEWSFPKPTHSHDALLVLKWITGEYWECHRVSRKKRPQVSSSLRKKLEQLSAFPPQEQPWQTIADAIMDLPDPEKNISSNFLNHILNPGAKVYPGHTGSPLDEPAKTLKAGDHGVPGGENMVELRDGRVRYFTVRESARLQTFPDDYIFHGSWTETMRQLGNAVPVKLAAAVASSIQRHLNKFNKLSKR